ncbi:MAG: hypothetical protein JW910_06015, partial [Anaerolineae bacterium]|nr:hypothetical protein [Anaerolineae bacterium]
FICVGDTRTRDLNLKLAAELATLDVHVTISAQPEHALAHTLSFDMPATSMWMLPLAEIVPLQLLAAALTARHGLDIDTFRYIGKVTTRE